MLQRHTTKPSDPKIFISHIPLLNFPGTALHITPRMCANPSWRHTTKSQTPRFSSHTSLFILFWTLPEQLSILDHACVPTHPEPMLQRHTTKPQTLRFLSHTSLYWIWPNSSPCYTTHVSQPILNQRPKTHYKLQSENFHLTHPCFQLCLNNSEQMTPRMCAKPLPNQRSKDTPQNLRPQDFHLTHPSFELCRSSSPYYTTHVCQPILSQRPKTHYKLQIRTFSSHTSLFWTLPEQLAMLHHTRPKTHYRTFSSHTSLF